MGAAAIPIISAAIAAGGTTYGVVSANNARKDAQGAADAQAKQQQANIDREKAKEAANQQAEQTGLVASQNAVASQQAGGFRSTIGTTPSGLVGVGVTGGTKTLLGS
jgi:hypothetical protein